MSLNVAPCPQPVLFSSAEYQRRWAGARAALGPLQADALAVTAPIHIEYLTGYGAGGADMAPFFLLVTPTHPPLIVGRIMDEVMVQTGASIAISFIPYFSGPDDAAQALATALSDHGLRDGTLAMELDNWGLTGGDVERVRRALPGLNIVDGSHAMAQLMDVKSDEELRAMRAAMRATDHGFQAFFRGLREGTSELQLQQETFAAFTAAGGEIDASSILLLFGARTALPHATASTNALKRGDVATLETGAYRYGYAAGIGRTAVFGRHLEAERLLDVANEAVSAGIAAVKPGVAAGSIDHAVRDVVQKAGYGDWFRHRAGYSIGLRWNSRRGFSVRPGSQELVRRGMTLQIICGLCRPQSSFGISTGDTVEVTETGSVVMSSLPRQIYRAGS